jgi:branched-chain amino acid aminotransferase
LELAEKLGIKFRETPLAPYDLFTADECFLTGTGAELIPVGHADGRALPECPGPVYQHLSAAFKQLVNQAL